MLSNSFLSFHIMFQSLNIKGRTIVMWYPRSLKDRILLPITLVLGKYEDLEFEISLGGI